MNVFIWYLIRESGKKLIDITVYNILLQTFRSGNFLFVEKTQSMSSRIVESASGKEDWIGKLCS